MVPNAKKAAGHLTRTTSFIDDDDLDALFVSNGTVRFFSLLAFALFIVVVCAILSLV